jgi:hypothetical protein
MVTYSGSKKVLRIPFKNSSGNITVDALMISRLVMPENGICARISLGAD